MHVGHAGVLAPFKINGPMRVAERAATLDILSGGRFELGLAKSGGKEWETFGVNPETARGELREALQMIPKMWTDPNFAWKSDLIDIPERDVVPKPFQKPHPRLWQTSSSPDSFRMAGELGIGVLGTTLLSPVGFMKSMLDEYDAGIASCKAPAGKFINNQKGVFTFVHVAESRKQAIESGAAWSALWYVHAAPITRPRAKSGGTKSVPASIRNSPAISSTISRRLRSLATIPRAWRTRPMSCPLSIS
jgi:alkanesulfonate monooxygenase SsuD/methylene tetrahydromethanopterin reductase-like flavin-dependent oxidoreductase (luciferase family)